MMSVSNFTHTMQKKKPFFQMSVNSTQHERCFTPMYDSLVLKLRVSLLLS